MAAIFERMTAIFLDQNDVITSNRCQNRNPRGRNKKCLHMAANLDVWVKVMSLIQTDVRTGILPRGRINQISAFIRDFLR